MPNGACKDNRSTRYMQLGLGWIFVGAYAVENGRLSQIAVLGASSLYSIGTFDTTASAGRNTRWTRMYSIGTGSREFWMHLWRIFSKRNSRERDRG